MSDTLAARVARALYWSPPERVGIRCDEYVLRKGLGRSCGRVSVTRIEHVDDDDWTQDLCKLHTTVWLRSSIYRVLRPLTDADHARKDDDRLIAWVAQGQSVIDLLAAAGLSVEPVRSCVFCSTPDRAGPCFGGDKCMAGSA